MTSIHSEPGYQRLSKRLADKSRKSSRLKGTSISCGGKREKKLLWSTYLELMLQVDMRLYPHKLLLQYEKKRVTYLVINQDPIKRKKNTSKVSKSVQYQQLTHIYFSYLLFFKAAPRLNIKLLLSLRCA